MENKKVKWLSVMVILLLGLFATGYVVFADDDHDRRYDYEEKVNRDFSEEGKYREKDGDKYYKFEKHHDDDDEYDKYDKHHDDDDDDDEYWENDERGGTSYLSTQKGIWNFWMRDAVNFPNAQLPIEDAKEVTVKIDGTQTSIYVIPANGQLLVPGEKMAKALSAKVNFYSKSRILVISKNKTELIVRAGSNAAFENKQKTPMPVQAQYIEKSVYIPISVVANSLGYRVSWDATEQCLILQAL